MAVVCQTEHLGTTVPAYSAVTTSTSLARHTVCRYCGLHASRMATQTSANALARWNAKGTCSETTCADEARALGLFFTYLDGHISRPPALLDAESVKKSGGLFAK